MIKLEEFMDKKDSIMNQIIKEGRKPKNQESEPDAEDVIGKDAEANGTNGLWAVDEPTDEDINTKLDKESLNKNMKLLLMKFKAKDDFFVIGEAGWGKSSIIKSLAKKQGRSIITVYLDKAEAVDLGGIPTVVKGKRGGVHQQLAMPAWAEYMWENPKKKFLLFFDEMNQAAPDVQNALMPIVLEHEICGRKFDNFFVGAAGNFDYENEAVSELSGPLKSRFKPLIIWKSGGDEWKSAFKYLHKKWDNKLSKKFVDKFEENAELFNNPREIEHKIFKFVYNLKEDGDYDYFDAEDYYDRLSGLAKDDLTDQDETVLSMLGEFILDYMEGKQEEEETGGRKKAEANPIDENTLKRIRHGIKFGYIPQQENGKTVKYGISRENIIKTVIECYDDELLPEQIERAIRKFKNDGIDFKFQKDSEWKSKGYLDPLE